MKPKSLREIYKEHGTIRFRFRNVITLADYLAVSILTWSGSVPEWVYVLSLNPRKRGSAHLNADFPNFALLSSKEEMERFANMQETELLELMKLI